LVSSAHLCERLLAPSPPAELSRSYAANAAAADDYYKGHIFRVTGTVRSTRRDVVGDIVLQLGDESRSRPIEATIHQSATHMAMRLSKGDTVGVNCVVKGILMKSPVVDDCRF